MEATSEQPQDGIIIVMVIVAGAGHHQMKCRPAAKILTKRHIVPDNWKRQISESRLIGQPSGILSSLYSGMRRRR
jgi:hypothetical protein